MLRERVREALLGAGLSEATLSSFIAQRRTSRRSATTATLVARREPDDRGPAAAASEPVRRAPARGAAQRRARRRVTFGSSSSGRSSVAGRTDAELPDETEHVAFVLAGNASPSTGRPTSRLADAFDAKGVIELVLDELGVGGWTLEHRRRRPLVPPGPLRERLRSATHDRTLRRGASVRRARVRPGCRGRRRRSRSHRCSTGLPTR